MAAVVVTSPKLEIGEPRLLFTLPADTRGFDVAHSLAMIHTGAPPCAGASFCADHFLLATVGTRSTKPRLVTRNSAGILPARRARAFQGRWRPCGLVGMSRPDPWTDLGYSLGLESEFQVAVSFYRQVCSRSFCFQLGMGHWSLESGNRRQA